MPLVPFPVPKPTTLLQSESAGMRIVIYCLTCGRAKPDDPHIVRQRIDNAVINTALSNSFGFGGTNASLVFQRLEK